MSEHTYTHAHTHMHKHENNKQQQEAAYVLCAQWHRLRHRPIMKGEKKQKQNRTTAMRSNSTSGRQTQPSRRRASPAHVAFTWGIDIRLRSEKGWWMAAARRVRGIIGMAAHGQTHTREVEIDAHAHIGARVCTHTHTHKHTHAHTNTQAHKHMYTTGKRSEMVGKKWAAHFQDGGTREGGWRTCLGP